MNEGAALVRREGRGIGFVFLVALFVRALVVLWADGRVPPAADGTFYDTVARRIALGQGYSWLWPDGTVTNAAHYPIGYPGLLGIAYRLLGADVGVAFWVNAFVGAAAAPLSYLLGRSAALRLGHDRAERVAVVSGLLVALLPSLWLYTPALMTEGPILTLLLAAAVLADRLDERLRAQGKVGLLWFALGLVLGVSTLFRPQSIVFAPLFPLVLSGGASFRRRVTGMLCVTAVAFAVVLPWTARNCAKMDRCTFVSANGGWNLLIGTFPEGKGGFAPVDGERVPEECREVFPEVAKDQCFGRAGVRRISEHPVAWLGLIPDKLRVTFDYTGVAAEYLLRAGALAERGHLVMGGLEIVSQRLLCLLALLGFLRGKRLSRASWVLSFGVALGLLGLGAYLGQLCFLLLLVSQGQRAATHERLLALTLAVTVGIHAAFFGAGRYSLPLLPFFAPLAALSLVRARGGPRLFDRTVSVAG